MSFADTTESDLLKLIMQNTSWANVGNAGGILQSTVAGSLYASLHTATLTDTCTQTTSEATYTSYARVAIARSSAGWTIAGTSPTSGSNTAACTFPTCGVTGNTVTDFQIGRDSSGAGETLWYGALTSSLIINNGITPSYAIGALAGTLD
jgi:hypothetical protein